MRTPPLRRFVAAALVLAVGLSTLLAPLASSSPDGLERVAEDHGFVDRGRLAPVQAFAPIPDYAFPGVEDPRVATALAGLVGTLGLFLLGYGLARQLHRRRGASRAATPGT